MKLQTIAFEDATHAELQIACNTVGASHAMIEKATSAKLISYLRKQKYTSIQIDAGKRVTNSYDLVPYEVALPLKTKANRPSQKPLIDLVLDKTFLSACTTMTYDVIAANHAMQQKRASKENKAVKVSLVQRIAYAKHCAAGYQQCLSLCKTAEDFANLYDALDDRQNVDSDDYANAINYSAPTVAIGQKVRWRAAGKVARSEGVHGKVVTGVIESIGIGDGKEPTVSVLPDHRKHKNSSMRNMRAYVEIAALL